jgi:hypothetical protein
VGGFIADDCRGGGGTGAVRPLVGGGQGQRGEGGRCGLMQRGAQGRRRMARGRVDKDDDVGNGISQRKTTQAVTRSP